MRNLLKNNTLATFMVASLLLSGASVIQAERVYAAEKAQVQVDAKTAKVVNINQAGSEELQTVRGIGPVIAKRILDYRAAHGNFAKLEDLRNVQGIGEAKFEKIRAQIAV